MDTYKTIVSPSQGLYKDKGSKFIALAFPVETEEDVTKNLERVRKEYYDARHHCYAYALGQGRESFRYNDDGEPSGTAGKPIFGQMLSTGLTNLLVVVVRYFGGIKLGTRGLIDAYKGATSDALENATVITKIIELTFKIRYNYLAMNEVMKVLKDNDLPQFGHLFDNDCEVYFRVGKSTSVRVTGHLEKIHSVSISKVCKGKLEPK